MKEKEEPQLEYTPVVQKLFMEMMLTDSEIYVRVANIFNPENFSKQLRHVAVFIKTHIDEHKSLPTKEQILATTGVELNLIPSMNDGHADWALTEFEKFTKRQELERAILKAADLLEKGGDFSPVEALIKAAVQISLQKDLGTDYFADPRGRLLALQTKDSLTKTGWPTLDYKLYGGVNRGELNIFCAGSGVGKSLFLQNLAVNWINAGLNGVYITLELNEGLTGKRIDSMMTGTPTKEVFRDIDNVELKVKILEKKSGRFQLKYLPAQSNVNDIRAYCKELQIKTGNKLDFLCVDYLDLMMPVSVKVSAENLFIKDKYVSEELRNLAIELNVLLATASQLNRCLSLDTMVVANGSPVRIDSVQVGDLLSSNEGVVTVNEVMPIARQSAYEVTLRSGKKIVCSAKHLFPTRNGLRSIENGLTVGTKLYTSVMD